MAKPIPAPDVRLIETATGRPTAALYEFLQSLSGGGGGGGGTIGLATTATAGIVELATGAEALGGTDATRAVTSAALASGLNKSTNGYVRLPGGLIIQWGTTAAPSNGSATTTFPVAFPAACSGAAVSINVANNAALLRSAYVTSVSATQLVTEHRSIDNTGVISAAAAPAFYIAIGY